MTNARRWRAGAPVARNSEILGIPDWVDVELLGSLNLHFVSEDAVNDDSCRMVRYFRSISVVGVSLFPYSSVFQVDHCSAGQSVKCPIHTAYKHIELGVLDLRGPLRSLLFSDLSVALQPGVQLF